MKEYITYIFNGGPVDQHSFERLLNDGWTVVRADSTDLFLVYILERSIPEVEVVNTIERGVQSKNDIVKGNKED